MSKKNKEKLISESLEIIFVQRINRPFVLRQKGRIIAHGKKDMYICRDKAGFCWIETCKNLKTTHQLLNITKNSFFVMMNVCIRKSEKQFSVEKKEN